MRTIEINNNNIKANLSVFLFKDGEVYHAYCPELDLVGYDYSEEGAKKSFEIVLKDYFDYALKNGTLDKDLLEHGWKKSKSGEISEPTYSVLLRTSQLKDILSRSEFSKYSIPVAL